MADVDLVAISRSLATETVDALRSSPPELVMATARRHGVEAIVADLLLRASDTASADRFSRAALERVVREAAARELSAARDVSRVCEGAHREGVDLLLLKGAALAYTHYPMPHLRPRNDLDLFIRRDDLDRAERMLIALDYERAPEANAALWTGQRHYVGRAHATAVDLHWRVVNPLAFAEVLRFDDARERSAPVVALGPFARTLSAPDALLLACVHRVAHHQDRVDLLWLLDIHLIVSRLAEPEVVAFIARAAEARMQTVVARSLRLACQYFGTTIPAPMVEAGDAAPSEEPAAAFLRGGLRQLDVMRADLAALPSWGQRLELVREHLFPPVSYMRQKYTRCPKALLPFAYLHRVVHGAPKWFARNRS